MGAMNLFRGAVRTLTIAFGLFCAPAMAQTPSVSIVRIQADTQTGVGYAIARGNDCLIVTARHVVYPGNKAPAASITVIDRNQFKSTGSPVFLRDDQTHDYAVIQVSVPKEFDCRSAWQDGSELSGRLDQAMTGDPTQFFIVSLDATGQKAEPGTVTAQDRSTFQLRANVRQGNSGSPVIYAGGRLAGITLSVTPQAPASAKKGVKPAPAAGNTGAVVSVLRQDFINDQVKDLVKVPGTTILFTGVFYAEVPELQTLATLAARTFFERQPKIILRQADQSNIGPDGNISNFGDAEYVFMGQIIQGSVTPKQSLSSRGKLLGRVLSRVAGLQDLGSALSAAGEAGEALKGEEGTYKIALRTQYTLYNTKTRQTFTEVGNFTGEETGTVALALGRALEKAVGESLPKLVSKAGLSQDSPTAPVTAPKVILPGQ